MKLAEKLLNILEGKFVDDKLKPFNKKEKPQKFKNSGDLNSFIKKNNIKDRQEFWFTVKGEDVLFKSFFEYTFEG